MRSVLSLEHRNDGQKLNYNHMGGDGNVRFGQLSKKCQSCGSACADTMCDSCKAARKKYNSQFGTAVPKSGWEQLLKSVTVDGLEVKVNGVTVRTAYNYIHAIGIKKSLDKQYARENYICLQNMKGKGL